MRDQVATPIENSSEFALKKLRKLISTGELGPLGHPSDRPLRHDAA